MKSSKTWSLEDLNLTDMRQFRSNSHQDPKQKLSPSFLDRQGGEWTLLSLKTRSRTYFMLQTHLRIWSHKTRVAKINAMRMLVNKFLTLYRHEEALQVKRLNCNMFWNETHMYGAIGSPKAYSSESFRQLSLWHIHVYQIRRPNGSKSTIHPPSKSFKYACSLQQSLHRTVRGSSIVRFLLKFHAVFLQDGASLIPEHWTKIQDMPTDSKCVKFKVKKFVGFKMSQGVKGSGWKI